jgi:phytoene dehydrogenase-like protein
MKILVIGFGVNSLTTSIKLLEEGHNVTVYVDKLEGSCSETGIKTNKF